LEVKKHIKKEPSDDNTIGYQIILFLLWPVLALIVALRNYKKPESRHIVTLFCGFIGMTFLVVGTSDAVRYREQFLSISQSTFSDFWLIVTEFIYDQESADISRETIFFIISRFTADPFWLWTTLGVMFGYIYSKNIWFLLKESDYSVNLNSIIFLVAIFFIITPTQGINQFRFWIAAHVFFYGAMHIVLFKNPRYFLILLLAPLIHFGLMVPILAVFVFYIFGRRDFVYIPIAIASAALAEIDFQMLSGYVELLGPAVESRFEGYTRDAAFERAEDLQDRSWYVAMWQPLLLYMTYGMLAYTHVKLKKSLSDAHLNMFSFLLILVTLFNLISHFPMIYRYLPVLFLFVFAFFFLVYNHFEYKGPDLFLILCLIPILLMIAVQTRIMFAYIDVSVIIFNPVFAILGEFGISLYEFLL